MHAIFLRHAESTYNLRGLCNGDPAQPVPLTARGRAQACEAGWRLRDAPIERIYVSEFARARQTAQAVNAYHGAPLHMDARLNDRRNGFEGRPVRDYLAAVQGDPLAYRPADGETHAELAARVDDFLNTLLCAAAAGAPAPGCVLVVTHHEVLQVVHARRYGLDAQALWRFWIAPAEFFAWHLPQLA